MLHQLLIGCGLILVSCMVACLLWWALENTLDACADWIARPPFGRKMAASLSLTLICAVLFLTFNVMLWAAAFLRLELFEGWEPAIYFALVTYTTLGYGDVLLPEDWRLLGGMAASNGLLNFGIVTAMMIETMRSVRTVRRGH